MHYNHMTTKFLSLASLAGVFFMNACSPGEEQTGTGYPQAFDVSNMDTSMAPCQDFDNFANGTWKKNNPIPASESRWGSFNILLEENEAKLQQIVDDLLEGGDHATGSNEQLIRSEEHKSELQSLMRISYAVFCLKK